MLNLEKWNAIVREVDKTSVPVECILKLVIRLEGRKQRTINIQALRKRGLDSEAIEAIINAELEAYGDAITSVNFFIDVESVADIVQPETDRLLDKL